MHELDLAPVAPCQQRLWHRNSCDFGAPASFRKDLFLQYGSEYHGPIGPCAVPNCTHLNFHVQVQAKGPGNLACGTRACWNKEVLDIVYQWCWLQGHHEESQCVLISRVRFPLMRRAFGAHGREGTCSCHQKSWFQGGKYALIPLA